ncbi:hypothetical protein DFH06DRAFT_1318724 [Mycena polygramma]|nr:hypothetical protein DFH06DRAFT_1314362 [Mycena polygramma]KAJ7983274.1 hypothetical protein DFH06DRAFT_1318724 [Mycena polygramma]
MTLQIFPVSAKYPNLRQSGAMQTMQNECREMVLYNAQHTEEERLTQIAFYKTPHIARNFEKGEIFAHIAFSLCKAAGAQPRFEKGERSPDINAIWASLEAAATSLKIIHAPADAGAEARALVRAIGRRRRWLEEVALRREEERRRQWFMLSYDTCCCCGNESVSPTSAARVEGRVDGEAVERFWYEEGLWGDSAVAPKAFPPVKAKL